MLQSIDKKNKIFFYLFLFFFLSTISNLSLNSLNFNIKNISVSGLSNENNSKITNDLNNLIEDNIFFISKNLFSNVFKKYDLIHSFNVKKIYPNQINIIIKQTEFLAIMNNSKDRFFIGSNGKLIKFVSLKKRLPNVFGVKNVNDFMEFKKILELSDFQFDKISEFYRFPSGRWDIKMEDGPLIKLSEKKISDALNLVNKIINNKEFENSNIVDLRIEDNVIITNE